MGGRWGSIATHLLESGVDIRYVQVFLDHADLATTQIYTRIVGDHLKRGMTRAHPGDRMRIPLRRTRKGVK
jgi:site-specific recombinase XerD